MPLKGQELHFADQIDGLLERVGRIERFLGGRRRIDEFEHSNLICRYSLIGHAGDPCPVCGEGPCPVLKRVADRDGESHG